MDINNIVSTIKQQYNNKKIVLASGCFDLLHVGHIRFIKQAKEQGDVLVLGVNSDISIKKIKGVHRPLRPQQERLEILSAIEFVDLIFPFDEESCCKYIRMVKPDVFAIGIESLTEYPEEVVCAKKENVELFVINRIGEYSTSNLIHRFINEVKF